MLVVAVVVGTIIGLTMYTSPEAASTATVHPGNPHPVHTFPPSSAITARYAAVASNAELCSQIGTETLARGGGSAVDAALAALICVGVLNRHHAGVGGGFFMTVYDIPKGESERRAVTILSRETAPQAAHKDMFVNRTRASVVGGLSIGVPGEVAGYLTAWRMFGRVPWRDLFTPTIQLLRSGYIVCNTLAKAIHAHGDVIKGDPNLSVFLGPDGEPLQEGDIGYDFLFANTLEKIAEDPEDFYNGSLAQDIVHDIADYGGIITLADLGNYTTKVKDAVWARLKTGDMRVMGPPPPSGASVLQYILGILDGYGFNKASIGDDAARTLSYHRIAEAFKFAYGKRSALGDEDFVSVDEIVANLTSSDYAEETRQKICDTQTQNMSYYEPAFESESDHGTTHLSVMGADGSAVAVTSTINLWFGSLVRGPRTGIVFNDEMDDFSTPGVSNSFGFPSSPSNYIEPGKMPMSSMSPTIVLDGTGNPLLVTGGTGGSRIISATALVAINRLWFGLDLRQATDEARIHHQLMPNYIRYEQDLHEFRPDVVQGLLDKGHTLMRTSSSLGVVCSIYNSCASLPDGGVGENCLHAVSDGRIGGVPDGY